MQQFSRYWAMKRVLRDRSQIGRFSNRPVGVKCFQTIHHSSVDVAHGVALLFRIGTKALVWGFFSQEVYAGGASFSFVVSLSVESPFLYPDSQAAP
jgi:hypothetical protein